MEGSSKIHKHSVEQGTDRDRDRDRDRLSELPDSVLLHILSFLDLQYVVPTSILSKRWRNLWKSVPDMDFQWLRPTPVHWPINFVEQSLSRREGSKIRKFRICIQSDDYPAEQLNSWISVVARHTIEELHLDFSPDMGDELDTNDDRYVTPHCIYNCTSLVSLTLKRCKIALPPSMCLSSLKTLYLGRVDLTDDVMRALISGCPLLEDLTLYDCNRCDDLNIFAENSRLKSLKIIEWDYLLNTDETKLGIFAPNLLSLDFVDHIPRKCYDVKSLLSLVVASFSFDGLLDQDCYKTTNFAELLDQIRHAKVLKLCSGCIVDLSIREIRGSSNSVFSSVSTLVLKTGLCIYELPGMIYMLRSFINLEVLIIDVEEGDESYKFEEHFQDSCEFDEIKWWKSLESFFSDRLHHIKTIKIRPIFMGSECTAQKIGAADIEDVEKQRNMITQKTNEEMVECILKGKGNMIGFIRILVENSAVLEKFTITTKHQRYYVNLVFTF